MQLNTWYMSINSINSSSPSPFCTSTTKLMALNFAFIPPAQIVSTFYSCHIPFCPFACSIPIPILPIFPSSPPILLTFLELLSAFRRPILRNNRGRNSNSSWNPRRAEKGWPGQIGHLLNKNKRCPKAFIPLAHYLLHSVPLHYYLC